MIDIAQFPQHLDTLKATDWQGLFALLPQIREFEQLTADQPGDLYYSVLPRIITDTTCIIRTLGLAPVFDWVNWQEAREILADEGSDYDKLDRISLCKLLTVIIRADRFSEGYLLVCFRNGKIRKIIKALQKKLPVEG